MWNKLKRSAFIFVLIGMGYIAVAVVVRNESLTFCIDSKFVNKIDIINQGQISDSIWACSVRTQNKSSTELEKIRNLVYSRSEKLLNYLNEYHNFKKKIYIQVDTSNPLKFEVDTDSIIIGSGLLESQGHLERALIKKWLSDYDLKTEMTFGLFEESLADLIYYSIYGDLKIFDPTQVTTINIETPRWPQVLQNLDHYCESPWKLSEDYLKCSRLNNEIETQVSSQIKGENRKQIVTASLRPLLSSTLIMAYQSLTKKEQQDLFRNIPVFIKNKTIDKKNVLDFVMLGDDDVFSSGLAIVKLFSDYFSLDKSPARDVLKKYAFLVNKSLEKQGVNISVAEAQFDLVIDVPDSVSVKSEMFKSLDLAAKMNRDMQIALRDKQSVYVLPSKTSLSRKLFDKLTTQQLVFFACPILKTIDINQYVGVANKVLLVKGCKTDRKYSFDLLAHYGAEEFVKKEDQLDVVQFHMPSYELKSDDLKTVNNFFDIVEKRDVETSELKSLGWQDLQWNDQLHIYKPRAVVDAIEFFRVETLKK